MNTYQRTTGRTLQPGDIIGVITLHEVRTGLVVDRVTDQYIWFKDGETFVLSSGLFFLMKRRAPIPTTLGSIIHVDEQPYVLADPENDKPWFRPGTTPEWFSTLEMQSKPWT